MKKNIEIKIDDTKVQNDKLLNKLTFFDSIAFLND